MVQTGDALDIKSETDLMQLHHFFILTHRLAQEADLLTDFGLIEGTSNDHPGQGTANRRFFFSNAALELLYVRDANEADDGPGHGLRFTERVSNPDASPFGLVLKNNGDSGGLPFAGWRYQPKYFSSGVEFFVADSSDRLNEPLCICIPDNLPSGPPQRQSEAPFTEVTELRLHVPVDKPSAALKAVAHIERIQIKTNSPHFLEIFFGHGIEGKQRDFRPRLPLRVLW